MELGKLDYTVRNNQHGFFLFQYGKNAPIGLPTNGGPQLPLPYTSTRTALEVIWVAQAGYTWTITPHLINVLRLQFNRYETPFFNPTAGDDYPAKAGLTGLPPGLPSAEFPSIAFGGPDSPTEWANNGYNESFSQIANSFVYQDSLQWEHGRHSVTFGGQVLAQQENTTVANTLSGLNFANTETAGFNPTGAILSTTGNAYASYLLGDVDNASATNTTVPETGARYKNYAVYAQDDWRLTPKLKINLGIRYNIPKPFIEAQNRNSWLNPTISNAAVDGFHGALQFDGNGTDSCHCSTQVQTHYTAIDPRIGAAYAFTPKTVLRGSLTINHFNGGALGGNDYSQGTSLLGYAANPSFTSPDAGITPAFNWNSGFPAYTLPPFFDPTLNTGYNTTAGDTGGSVSYNRPTTAGRSPYTENWNITVDQAFTPSLTFQLTYGGSQSHFIAVNGGVGIYSDQMLPQYMVLGNLLQQTLTPTVLAAAQAIFPGITTPYANFDGSLGQALRPFPQYSGVADLWNGSSNASYNSLQTSLQKRMAEGLYFLAAYTWSKTINENGGIIQGIYGVPRSAYNLAAERTVSPTDTPQNISIAYVYNLPLGVGHTLGSTHSADIFVGGWSISGINQYSSGTPIGPIGASCDVPYAGPCYADYGNTTVARINGKYGSGDPRTTPYINVAAFATPASFTFGDTPRAAPDGLRNPWNLNETVSVGKNFHLPEKFVIRSQADAFNVFNRTVFGGIATDINSSNFGEVTGQSNSPRQLQFEGSIHF